MRPYYASVSETLAWNKWYNKGLNHSDVEAMEEIVQLVRVSMGQDQRGEARVQVVVFGTC